MSLRTRPGVEWVEDPQTLAGLRVVPAHVTFLVRLLFGTPPGRCAAPTTITSPTTSGVACRPTSPGDEIHRLVVFLFQIDDAVLAEAGDRLTGLRVERQHLVTRCDVDDAFVTATVGVSRGRVRELGAERTHRVCLHRRCASRSFRRRLHRVRRRHAWCPQPCAITPSRPAVLPGGCTGARTETIGLESPCHFELLKFPALIWSAGE